MVENQIWNMLNNVTFPCGKVLGNKAPLSERKQPSYPHTGELANLIVSM